MLRTTHTLPLLAAAVLAALVTVGASPASARPDLDSATTFAFAIGERALKGTSGRLAGYDVVVVDGEETSAQQVARMRAAGSIVLGYISVGTVENWRSWHPLLRPYAMEQWDDWEGERYADTSKPGFRAAMTQQIAPAILAKGFDGLFLDNVAMIEDHRRQVAGMRQLVAELDAVLGPDRLLFAQNGDDIIEPFLRHLDGWNREDVTATYDFDRKRYVSTGSADRKSALQTLRRVRSRGVFTTTTDYTRAGSHPLAGRAVRGACGVGAVPYVSDIDLNRVGPATRCAAR